MYIYSCKHTWKHSNHPETNFIKISLFWDMSLRRTTRRIEVMKIWELLEKLGDIYIGEQTIQWHVMAVFKYLKICHTEHVHILNEPEGISRINKLTSKGVKYKFILKPYALRMRSNKGYPGLVTYACNSAAKEAERTRKASWIHVWVTQQFNVNHRNLGSQYKRKT